MQTAADTKAVLRALPAMAEYSMPEPLVAIVYSCHVEDYDDANTLSVWLTCFGQSHIWGWDAYDLDSDITDRDLTLLWNANSVLSGTPLSSLSVRLSLDYAPWFGWSDDPWAYNSGGVGDTSTSHGTWSTTWTVVVVGVGCSLVALVVAAVVVRRRVLVSRRGTRSVRMTQVVPVYPAQQRPSDDMERQ